jgi:hypothetical protein
MESRRDALKMMLVTAAGAAGGAGATATKASFGESKAREALAKRDTTETAEAGATPWTLISPLQPGDTLGGTWKLAALGAITAGAVVVELHDLEGQQARIHICARKGEALGLASTPHLDLLLMNGGNGTTTSNEHLGRVVLGLAALIEQNEGAAFQAHPGLTKLLSHDERLRAFKGSPALS